MARNHMAKNNEDPTNHMHHGGYLRGKDMHQHRTGQIAKGRSN